MQRYHQLSGASPDAIQDKRRFVYRWAANLNCSGSIVQLVLDEQQCSAHPAAGATHVCTQKLAQLRRQSCTSIGKVLIARNTLAVVGTTD